MATVIDVTWTSVSVHVIQIRKTSKYSTLEIYSKKLLKGYLHKGKQGWGGINASCNNQYMLLKCAKRFDRPAFGNFDQIWVQFGLVRNFGWLLVHFDGQGYQNQGHKLGDHNFGWQTKLWPGYLVARLGAKSNRT